MISLKSLPQSPDAQLRQIGWDWMLGTDTLPYLTNEVVQLNVQQAMGYAEAANRLFEMLVEAGQHVIDQDRFAELGIPANLIDIIRHSWDDDRNILLYGRFDLAGGIDDAPVKLIEFNADTATCLPETAVVQYAHLKANGLDESQQVNAVFEALVAQFEEIKAQNDDLTPTILLSAMRDSPEDDANVALLGEAAREAGFEVAFAYIDEVEFSATEGIYRFEDGTFTRFDFWFKLIPWEYIGHDEPELATILTQLVKERKVVILNPAYALLFQSKYMLKVLWELFPESPLLLETTTEPLLGKASVEKVLFGREGANVRILDATGQVTQSVDGDYGDQDTIYQQYVDFPQDAAGNQYQAGVFFAGEACGLGFRRGGAVIDNTAQFVGHIVE
ncbi:glutathionylspermidine synthase family protein [Fibrella forsythiae]|uniref:Glutathionylspermidine synthase family protein n=1 Tax=Fibrella forsythiae TaxID=2817061 RepID=A0ABS3JLI1_9BACT|nr:glutathionylspermidine synthase family protein [Fibrella forsythiae]MBO0950251.1 glutathionylspermidine synthase family protein [Fibrella forsythiae]